MDKNNNGKVDFKQISLLKSKCIIQIDNESYQFKVNRKYSLLWDLHFTLLRIFIALITIYKICEAWGVLTIRATDYVLITVIVAAALIFAKFKLEKHVRHYIYDMGAYTLSKIEK